MYIKLTAGFCFLCINCSVTFWAYDSCITSPVLVRAQTRHNIELNMVVADLRILKAVVLACFNCLYFRIEVLRNTATSVKWQGPADVRTAQNTSLATVPARVLPLSASFKMRRGLLRNVTNFRNQNLLPNCVPRKISCKQRRLKLFCGFELDLWKYLKKNRVVFRYFSSVCNVLVSNVAQCTCHFGRVPQRMKPRYARVVAGSVIPRGPTVPLSVATTCFTKRSFRTACLSLSCLFMPSCIQLFEFLKCPSSVLIFTFDVSSSVVAPVPCLEHNADTCRGLFFGYLLYLYQLFGIL
jgi:hypothetical protein